MIVRAFHRCLCGQGFTEPTQIHTQLQTGAKSRLLALGTIYWNVLVTSKSVSNRVIRHFCPNLDEVEKLP